MSEDADSPHSDRLQKDTDTVVPQMVSRVMSTLSILERCLQCVDLTASIEPKDGIIKNKNPSTSLDTASTVVEPPPAKSTQAFSSGNSAMPSKQQQRRQQPVDHHQRIPSFSGPHATSRPRATTQSFNITKVCQFLDMFPYLDTSGTTLHHAEMLNKVFLSFIFSYAWGFGGHLISPSSRKQFSELLRRRYAPNKGDIGGLTAGADLFDYVVDNNKSRMVKIDLTMNSVADLPSFKQFAIYNENLENMPDTHKISPLPSNILIPSHRTVIASFMSATMLESGLRPVLIGSRSSGKTANITHMLSTYGRNFPNFNKIGTHFSSDMNTDPKKGVERTRKSDPVHVLHALAERFRHTRANYGWESIEFNNNSPASLSRNTYSTKQHLRHLRHNMQKKTLGTVYISLNRGSTGLNVANTLFASLQTSKSGVLHPQTGSHAIIFVDDIHMVQHSSNSLTTSETLRGLCDIHGGGGSSSICKFSKGTSSTACFAPTIHNSTISDPGRANIPLEQHTLLRNSSLIASSSLSYPLLCSKFPRLARHFTPIALPSPSEEEIMHIFNQCVVNVFTRRGVFSDLSLFDIHKRTDDGMFSSDLTSCAPLIVDATCNFLKSIKMRINFHVVNKFLKGLTFIDPKVVTTRYVLARLWAHECIRNFMDPMDNGIDRNKAVHTLVDCCESFSLSISALNRLKYTLENHHKSPLLFSDIHTIAGMWAVDCDGTGGEDDSDDKGEGECDVEATTLSRRSPLSSSPTPHQSEIIAHSDHTKMSKAERILHLQEQHQNASFRYEEICSCTEAEEEDIPKGHSSRNRGGHFQPMQRSDASPQPRTRHSTLRRRRSSFILKDKNRNRSVLECNEKRTSLARSH